MNITISRLLRSALLLASLSLTACGGGSGGGGTSSTPPSGSGTSSNVNDVPAPFETCSVSPAGVAAPAVSTALVVQSSSGWNNTTGNISVVKNGARVARDSGLSLGVNCVSWIDANSKARAMNLGAFLFDYTMNWGANRYVATDDADGHPGFGYVVSHNTANGNSPIGSYMQPNSVKTTVFAGANHAIHQVTMNYVRDQEAGGNGIVIPVVIQWMVAAGRNDPVWVVNWEMDHVTNPLSTDFTNAYKMDSRGPYGSIGWDGKTRSSGTDEVVSQVEWGAGSGGVQNYLFVASDFVNGISNSTPWTYNQRTSVNYNKARPKTTPVEFGIVQTTQDPFVGYQDGVVGTFTGLTSAAAPLCSHPGSADNNAVMPCAFGWPYQMMQYSAADGSFAPTPTTGKLMAWGTPYGYLGATSFSSFDYATTTSGTGQRSYATYIVWGQYGNGNPGNTSSATDPVESAKGTAAASGSVTTTINNSLGTITTSAALPGSLLTHPLLANGWNETYGVFEITVASSGKSDVTFTNPGTTTMRRPIVVFDGYTGGTQPLLKLNGTALNSGVNYLASYDTDTKQLWVTFLSDLSPGQAWKIVLN